MVLRQKAPPKRVKNRFYGERLKTNVDVLISFQMNEVLTEPTRVSAKSKTLIDLVITNSKEKLTHTGVYPLSISGHYLIYAIRKIGIPRGQPRVIQSRNFKRFD